MMKKIMLIVIIICFFSVPISAYNYLDISLKVSQDYNPQSPNYMGFTTEHVTFGENATVTAWVNISSALETVSVDNMTYLPAGIVNYSSTEQGDLYEYPTWMAPELVGVIDNENGYAYPITMASTSVNNTNESFAVITMKSVGCGETTLTITAGGTALSGTDLGTTFETGKIYVHPETIKNFQAESYLLQSNLSWSKGNGTEQTLIRGSTTDYPSSITEGIEIYNGTGTYVEHTTLTEGDTWYYTAWSYNSTLYSLQNKNATSGIIPGGNDACSFGTPTPVNGSVDENIALNWSIPISDSDNDSISWTIECSDGNTSSGSGASPQSAFILLSELQYNTEYTIWVNATDSGNGTMMSSWYTFTTKENNLPILSNEDPADGAINIPTSYTTVSIEVEDPEGHDMDITIEGNYVLTAWADDWGNDTITASLSSGLPYDTTIIWYVNATDGYGWTNETYTFTTKENTPPIFGTPNPINGSTNQDNSLTWNIPISDSDNDLISWTVECSDGNTSSGSGASPQSASISLTNLNFLTTYTIWVNATDSGSENSTKAWYTFTTSDNNPPTFGMPNPVNGSIDEDVSLTWDIPITDPDADSISWTVECSDGNNSSGAGNSPETGTITLLSLNYGETYTIWVNASDPDGTNITNSAWYTFTTSTNLPPTIENIHPVNDSYYLSVYNNSLIVNVSDGNNDILDVTFYWGNGTEIGMITDFSGEITMNLSEHMTPSWKDWVSHDTNITWYAMVTDGVEDATSETWSYITTKAWDLNEDMYINYLDISILVSKYLDSVLYPGMHPWDINNDTLVNYLDISTLVSHYLENYYP